MLKWAVNGFRQSYLQNEDNSLQLPVKSSDLSTLRLNPSWLGKEKQYTSTPLQTSISIVLENPSHKVDCLRDLSNIVPELSNNSPLIFHANKEISKPLETTDSRQIPENLSNNYPSTLPTFDVEYSPSALIPGPMLALRGFGIPDSYFKKPRYIGPHFQDVLQNVNEETLLETKLLENPAKYPSNVEESNLSSTKMGDATLERMIDAILESSRKSPRHSHHQKQSTMSPTYTPAEDPATDLQEVWDSEKTHYRQRKQKLRARLNNKISFNEIENSSPLLHENTGPGHLRRQRCLRRKRKISQITTSVVSSAQKLLCKGRQQKPLGMHSNNMLVHYEMHPPKRLRNLSPDSGHNSSSDYDEKESDTTLHQCIEDDWKTLDNTKRRLSFSRI